MGRPSFTVTVVRTEWLGAHFVRVVFGGPDLAHFTPNAFTDAYVKLVFDQPDGQVTRTYTVRWFDAQAQELAIDFVVHGTEGIAGPWAASARPGAQLALRGPGGAYAPRTDVDWHLLAGDESALPAIATALEALPEGSRAQVFVEIGEGADELPLQSAAEVSVTWIHRGDSADSHGESPAGLVTAVRSAPWWPGQVGVFIHGEADTVMHCLRPFIRKEKRVPAAFASISGYWRRGRTEDGFRVWKRELAASEATLTADPPTIPSG